MNATDEVIALLLDESGSDRKTGSYSDGATRLVRDVDGNISLEDIESEEDFDRTARITGCFIRGKAIRDPETLEVIGYEMEEVSVPADIAR